MVVCCDYGGVLSRCAVVMLVCCADVLSRWCGVVIMLWCAVVVMMCSCGNGGMMCKW